MLWRALRSSTKEHFFAASREIRRSVIAQSRLNAGLNVALAGNLACDGFSEKTFAPQFFRIDVRHNGA